MNDTANNTPASAAVVVTGNPVTKGFFQEALSLAMADMDSVENELDEVAEDVAEWVHKEFHLIPKTAEEKTADQNAEAAQAKISA